MSILASTDWVRTSKNTVIFGQNLFCIWLKKGIIICKMFIFSPPMTFGQPPGSPIWIVCNFKKLTFLILPNSMPFHNMKKASNKNLLGGKSSYISQECRFKEKINKIKAKCTLMQAVEAKMLRLISKILKLDKWLGGLKAPPPGSFRLEKDPAWSLSFRTG